MFRSVCFFFFVFTCMPLVSSLPTGAPEAACATMAPGPPHRENGAYSTQTGPSPYRLTTYNNTEFYSVKGPWIVVTLDSPAGLLFKGFLVRAFDNNNNVIGTMHSTDWDGNTQLRCSGTAVTHTNNNTKDYVQFIWLPPVNDTGALYVTFTATVVQSKHVWWEKATFSPTIFQTIAISASSMAGSCILLTLLCSLMVLMLTNGHHVDTMDITYQ